MRSRIKSRSRLAGGAALLLTLGLLAVPQPASAAVDDPAALVNPLIGTDDSNAPEPVGGGAGGSTFPGATVPFGMTQFSPDTPTASPSGYRDSDRTIEAFSLTHFNGAGCPNNEDIGLLPITGSLATSPGTHWTDYASAYTKSNESATPGFYGNRLDRYGVDVGLSATTRTGVAKFTFPATSEARLLINASHAAPGEQNSSISINGNTITGDHWTGNFCWANKYFKLHYAIEFDRTPTTHGIWNGDTVTAGGSQTNGTNTGGYVTFDTTGDRTVQATVALSYVSISGAQANLAAEKDSFDAVRSAARSSWNNALKRIEVSGGGNADQQKFYTALYHVLQNPNIASDTDGQYRGFDGEVHTAAHPIYRNISGWDIYRSWAALMALIEPEIMTDVVKSMILDGQQGGLLPKWGHQNVETFVMPGDPGPIIVASAYAFGATGFDTAAALSLMKKAAAGQQTQGGYIRERQGDFQSKQFIPNTPSATLEYVASDFAIAQFARATGDNDTYNELMPRAQYWRGSYNGESGYIHPRNDDGTWTWPLTPGQNSPYTEGNAAQYTWMVPHNYGALVDLMGGPQTARQRLDHHFTKLNGGISTPYFYIGNEPEHSVPWAYNYARYPAGASSVVRRVMTESFTTGAGGLPGNDDLGATSAWYVWGALGMYPVTPGTGLLAVHGPLFPSATIKRAAGDVTITGGSASDEYVQSFSLHGNGTSRSYLQYGDIARGGTLAFTMGANPSGSWGTGASDVPPSYGDGADQPSAEPDLGPNLALGKPATGSTACSEAEGADKAVDGKLNDNSKWCSGAGTKFLTVDLGSAETVNAFVIKHAGLGGEQTGYNTGAFSISTSTDGSNWSQAVSVSGSRASRTYHPITARSARYVRLDVTDSANVNRDYPAARIFEFEVYGGPASVNLALNRPATADSQCGNAEGPEKAVNGSWLSGWYDKWCSTGSNRWLQVDLGARQHIGSVVIRHAGAGGEYWAWNTKNFDLQTSDDGSSWSTRAQVRDNTSDTTSTAVDTDARYLRLAVVTPTSNGDPAARIYDLEVRP